MSDQGRFAKTGLGKHKGKFALQARAELVQKTWAHHDLLARTGLKELGFQEHCHKDG
jgi:hypothetical protein